MYTRYIIYIPVFITIIIIIITMFIIIISSIQLRLINYHLVANELIHGLVAACRSYMLFGDEEMVY